MSLTSGLELSYVSADFDEEDPKTRMLPSKVQTSNAVVVGKKRGRPASASANVSAKGLKTGVSAAPAAGSVRPRSKPERDIRKALQELPNAQTASGEVEVVKRAGGAAHSNGGQQSPAAKAVATLPRRGRPLKAREADQAPIAAEDERPWKRARHANKDVATNGTKVETVVAALRSNGRDMPRSKHRNRHEANEEDGAVIAEIQPKAADVDAQSDADAGQGFDEALNRQSREPPAAALTAKPRGRRHQSRKADADVAQDDDDGLKGWSQAAKFTGRYGKKRIGDGHLQRPNASNVEADGDGANIERQFQDLVNKHAALERRYQELHDLSVEEKDGNFQSLKEAVDLKNAASDTLISSLRADLATQSALAADAAALRARVSELELENESYTEGLKTANTSLETLRSDVKALHARLAAARASSHSVENGAGRVPGSAVKRGAGGAPKHVFAGGGDAAAKEAHKRLLKEELYGDLTGLIVRDVVHKEGEGDVYDLIQTGRNGTLHFHLTLASSASVDAEFTYTPFLDESRDRDLFAFLPDYLTEEICFPRSNAAKFYARIADCMTKRFAAPEEAEIG